MFQEIIPNLSGHSGFVLMNLIPGVSSGFVMRGSVGSTLSLIVYSSIFLDCAISCTSGYHCVITGLVEKGWVREKEKKFLLLNCVWIIRLCLNPPFDFHCSHRFFLPSFLNLNKRMKMRRMRRMRVHLSFVRTTFFLLPS